MIDKLSKIVNTMQRNPMKGDKKSNFHQSESDQSWRVGLQLSAADD